MMCCRIRPRREASLKRGDVIRKFNGQTVRNITELRSLVSRVELNKKVELDVTRNGNPLKLTAEIKEQPADYLQFARESAPAANAANPE